MNNLIEAIVLGIVQGLTEFIPVSSSGHLAIIPYLFGWQTPSLIFDLALHAGTLVALIFYYRQKLWGIGQMVINPEKRDSKQIKVYRNVLIATVPAAIIGYIAQRVISQLYKSDNAETLKVSIIYTACALIVVGILFLIADKVIRPKKVITLSEMTISKAVIIGIAQAVALFRGVSRSGITLLTGQLMGLKRVDAAEFSFLMSIPITTLTTIFGIRELLSLDAASIQVELVPAIVGATAAAISGFLAISYMLKFLRKHGLAQFGVYRIFLGVFVLLLILT
jgi:undecaprenyl-diphosphatase